MEAKLKALKVADLKDILSAATVSAPARATKADLIAKVLASDAALAQYRLKHAPEEVVAAVAPPAPEVPKRTDSLLEPPDDEIAWSDPEDDGVKPAPVPAAAPATTPPPAAVPAPFTPTPSTNTNSDAGSLRARAERFGILATPATGAEAAEKLKARAARFGVTLPTTTSTPASTDSPTAPAAPTTEEEAKELEVRKARAARFGIPLVDPKTVTATMGAGAGRHGRAGRRSRPRQPALDDALTSRPQKPAAAAKSANGGATKRKSTSAQEDVDPEEAERRRKRAERFATGDKS